MDGRASKKFHQLISPDKFGWFRKERLALWMINF